MLQQVLLLSLCEPQQPQARDFHSADEHRPHHKMIVSSAKQRYLCPDVHAYSPSPPAFPEDVSMKGPSAWHAGDTRKRGDSRQAVAPLGAPTYRQHYDKGATWKRSPARDALSWMGHGTLLFRNHRVAMEAPVAVSATTKVESPSHAKPGPASAESFHRAICHILLSAQVFGLMPVCGICAPSPSLLRFKTRSFRMLWSFTLFLGVLVVELVSLRHMALTLSADTFGVIGGIGAATAGAVFYGNALMAAYLFLKLAGRWATLMVDWADMESVIRRGREPRLRLRFSCFTAAVMLAALFEHLMSIVNAVPVFLNDHWYGSPSNQSENAGRYSNLFLEFLHEYCLSSHAFIFEHVPYNPVSGIGIFILSKVTTFYWNFVDLFVILVSTGLAERFKQFNSSVINADVTSLKKDDWRELREYFAVLSSLTKKVDSNICSIVFLSFGNNLYFICLQLLNGLSPGAPGILATIYFFYSFFFLLGRTVMVTLVTARINDLSKEALSALFNCPSDTYNVEVARLQHQMASDDLALTGLRFFSITRNFMLAVAGAIATYEIVLLQFNVAISPPTVATTTTTTASPR